MCFTPGSLVEHLGTDVDGKKSQIRLKYEQVLITNPGIGEPVGGEKNIYKAGGKYQDYSGGASIYYSPETGAHLISGLIRVKWVSLLKLKEVGPNGFPISDEVTLAGDSGHVTWFQQGAIFLKKGSREAFAVWGEIFRKWKEEAGGAIESLGFPITDQLDMDLRDGGLPGSFNEFEHGAIYYICATGKTHIVRSPILEVWEKNGREKGRFKLPVSDTVGSFNPNAKHQPDAPAPTVSQVFEGGTILCQQSSSSALVSPTISCLIEPVTRKAILTDPGRTSDNRSYSLMDLTTTIHLKTLLVIFRKSFIHSMEDDDIKRIKINYEKATKKLSEFTFGMVQVHHETIIINRELTKNAFSMDTKTDDQITYADFKAYLKVRMAVEAEGKNIHDYDIVSINIPWKDPSELKAATFAHANFTPKFMWEGIKPWSTIHHFFKGISNPHDNGTWWAYYLHEITHCLEWMLEDVGFPELRNNDDPWWLRTYPQLFSSTVVPPPANLRETGDYTLYAILSRVKEHWLGLPPNWGYCLSAASLYAGRILMYSAPDENTFVEMAVDVTYE